MNLRSVKKEKITIDPNDNPFTKQLKTKFQNKYVVVTGTIPEFTRKQVHGYLSELGANTQDSVTFNTDILVTGYGCGQTKIKKAKSLGLDIVNYQDIEETFKNYVRTRQNR